MDCNLIWLSERTFSIHGGSPGSHSRFGVHLFGLSPGCLCLVKSRGSESVEVQRVWVIYDERLQLMARDDALDFEEALGDGDVSRAWNGWSSAAEAALAHAYQFAGGAFLVRTVRLGGPKVRKARKNRRMYHDASTALLLDLSVLKCDDSGWCYFGSVC